MKIETKFNIGDKIYLVNRAGVQNGVIQEIEFNGTRIIYRFVVGCVEGYRGFAYEDLIDAPGTNRINYHFTNKEAADKFFDDYFTAVIKREKDW